MISAPEAIPAPEGFENVMMPSANALENMQMMSQIPDGFEMFPAQNNGMLGGIIELNK
jgi:hypothetical protein